jgi:hypothetical protein
MKAHPLEPHFPVKHWRLFAGLIFCSCAQFPIAHLYKQLHAEPTDNHNQKQHKINSIGLSSTT